MTRLSWQEFAALCHALARRAASDFDPDVIVGIAPGGTLPGALVALLLRRDFHGLRLPISRGSQTVPTHQPPSEVVAGRRVLVVDETTADGSGLRQAVAALKGLGAEEVRTLTLFRAGTTRADYTGPSAGMVILQPWIRDVVMPERPVGLAGVASRQRHDLDEHLLLGGIHRDEGGRAG